MFFIGDFMQICSCCSTDIDDDPIIPATELPTTRRTNPSTTDDTLTSLVSKVGRRTLRLI